MDGVYAASLAEIRVVVGAETHGHMGGAYRSVESDMNAITTITARTGGLRVSSHVPAASNTNKQNGLIRLGLRPDMVAPIWSGVRIIEDSVTSAAKGEVILTGVMLHNVKILRASGFYKQQAQIAA